MRSDGVPTEIDHAWEVGRYADLLALIESWKRRSASVPIDDPARLTLRIRESRALRHVGRASDAAAEALSAVELGERLGGAFLVDALDEHAHHAGTASQAVLARALRLANAIGDAGRARRVAAHLSERMLAAGNRRGAEAILAEAGDGASDPYWCYAMGAAVLAREAPAEAATWLERTATLARDGAGRPAERLAYGARATAALGMIALAAADLGLAERRFREALGLLEGALFGGHERSVAWNGLGECARARADLDGAEDAYRAAAAEVPGTDAGVHQLNLAIVRVERGRVAEARADLERFLAGPGGAYPALERVARLALAACAADQGDAAAFDEAFRPFRAGWSDPSPDADIARLARLAATRATPRRGWTTRALRARRVALAVWDRIGRPREVAVEERAIRRLADLGASPQLGPFVLSAPLARGAFGTVWTARHDSGAEVAIKVLSRARGSREALDRELRAVAALDHPNIVRLLDHGTVDRAAAAMVPDLVAGSPWIATALARGGTLEPHLGGLPWNTVRDVLVAILDALAHAHARGLLHLDVKPANVLLDGSVPRLADFGLATAAGSGVALVAGTPAYMAPEQFRGREIGPWTDLYAVGCLAVALVRAAPPFEGPSLELVRDAHLHGQPSIAPMVAVPDGFDAWIRRLLVKHPPERFRRAADAARGLLQLGTASSGSGAAPVAAMPAAPTVVLPSPVDGGPPSLDVIGRRLAVPPPAVPRDWRRPHAPPPQALADAGLGLFALRAPVFVGREAERTALWEALRRVLDEGRAVSVLVRAEPGYGASSLAGWLCERAHEVGAASALVARGEAADVERALARHLGCAGLEPHEQIELLGRLHPEVSRTEVRLLADLLAGPATVGRRERRRVLVRAILHEARRRPVILWIDHPDPDLLLLADEVLGVAAPVLVVITARTDAAVAERPDLVRIALAELPDHEHRALLGALLPLTPASEEAVARATAGHPRFAVQLLTELAGGERLVATPEGWSLRPGTVLPGSLDELWGSRLRDVLVHVGPDAAACLRVAALLEPTVDDRTWAEACARAGLRFVPEVRDALLDARLARPRDGGFAFEDPALRHAAVGSEDPAPLHAACAEALVALGGDLAEIGRHWRGADRPGPAAAALTRAAAEAASDGSFARALRLCDELEVAGAALDGRERVRAEVNADHVRAVVSTARREHADAEGRLLRAHDRALDAGLEVEDGRILVQLAASRRQRSVPCEIVPELERLAGSAHPEVRTRALVELGRVERDGRRYDRALERFAAAVDAARDGGSDEDRARAEAGLGSMFRRVGRAPEGVPLLTWARDTMQAKGLRLNAALLTIDVGWILRDVGRVLEAEAELEAAEETLEALGSWAASLAAVRRALLLWSAGRHAEGDAVAARLGTGVAVAHVARLVEAAARSDDGWDDRVDAATTARAQFEEELEEGLALAEARARGAGRIGRAERLRALSGPRGSRG